MVKTILIGIDGASWNIIETLIKSEKLPFISKLVSNGTSGNLESSIPFLSSPAWKCLSTSKNPGKLGVYSFEQFTENGGIKIVNSKYFKAKEIWDFLSFNDYSNCIVNVPMTYPPPQNVKGIFISGIPALSHHNYSKPNHIKELLNKNMEYEINPKKQIDSLKEVNKQLDKLFSAIDISIEYNGDFDFIQFVIFFIDNLSHENWNKGKWNSLLKESWTSIDTKIAEFISKYSDEKCNIFIVSDHGMTSLKGVFYVNEWLASIGLLSFNRKNKINIILEKLIKLFNIDKYKLESIYNVLKKTRVILILESIYGKEKLYNDINKYVLLIEDPDTKFTKDQINIKNSKAICVGHGIHILEKAKYELIKKDILTNIIKIENPKNKDKIILNIKEKKEVYTGSYIDLAPDLILIPNKGYKIVGRTNRNNKIFNSKDPKWEGEHQIEGIFLAYGKDIKKNYKLEGAKIYDITPTILHIFGVPIPNDMDGRVLSEIFEADSEYSRKKTVYVDPDYYERKGNKEETKTRIRKLRKNANI